MASPRGRVTSAADFGGVVIRLEFPNGKSTTVTLGEIYQPGTVWRIQEMSRFWGGCPVICEPQPPAPEAA